jgi:hypothetical protein
VNLEAHASAGLIARPLDHIGTSASWLRDRLAGESVRLHPDSRLALALGRLDDFRTRALREDTFKFPSTDSAYDFLADAIGADFLSKTLHAGAEAGFRLPPERWRHLASGSPVVTRPGPHSTERNLTWEVVIASLAATFAENVRFDEPDVTCTFDGASFAVAAKVAYSEKKLFENVEEGFRQANGKALATLVFVDVVELYPVVETLRWSRSKKFGHNDEAVSCMTGSFTRWCDRFALGKTVAKIKERTKHPVGVAFFVPMLIEMMGQPVPFFYTHLPITWAETAPDFKFATAFLQACNTILGFRPEGTGATS